MKIDRLDVRLLRLPLAHFFETSFGRSYDRTFLLIRLEGEGQVGWGEAVAEAHPYYSSETTETTWHIITEFLAPRVVGQTFEHPRDIYPALARVRGHNMAKAGIEMAAWDLYARTLGKPLSAVLGGTREHIESGVSIGIQDSLDQLVTKVDKELAAGYRRIKIKIKPGWDVNAVEAVRAKFPDIKLMVDANAAYVPADGAHLAKLDPYNLMMIEQPLDYEDVMDHAQLQREITTPICLDESIHTVRIARDAIAAKACKIINVKPGRVGGHGESIRLHDLCQANGIPVWHGGMLESGIGRAHNIAMSTLEGFTMPGDVSASKRYWHEDIIEPAVEITSKGTIIAPEKPGIGFEIKKDRIDNLTIRQIRI